MSTQTNTITPTDTFSSCPNWKQYCTAGSANAIRFAQKNCAKTCGEVNRAMAKAAADKLAADVAFASALAALKLAKEKSRQEAIAAEMAAREKAEAERIAAAAKKAREPKDKNSNCPGWKKYCNSTYPGHAGMVQFMDNNCKKTCSL